MTDINLHPFCGNDPNRPYLQQPFSKDEWTYATDGRLMVRIPRRDSVPEIKEAPNAAKVFADNPDDGQFIPLPSVDIPPVDGDECEECDGRGTDHDCPACTCTCVECHGTGHPIRGHGVTVEIGPSVVAGRYYLLLQAIPSVELSLTEDRSRPVRFRFPGGAGLLMQVMTQFSTHLKAEMPTTLTPNR